MLGRGLQGKNAPSVFRVIGAIGKVCGPAGAGILPAADGLGAHLACQVDLQSRVHGDHVVVFHDVDGIVHIHDGQDLDHGIGVDVVVQILVAPDERADGPIAEEGLAGVVHRPAFHQFAHGRADHLGIDAQVVPVFQVFGHRVRHAADAKLDAVPVVDEGGGILCDLQLLRGHGIHRGLGDGIVHINEIVHLFHRHPDGAGGQGHMGVDLEDDRVAYVDHIQLGLLAHGHAHIAKAIHGRDRSKEYVGFAGVRHHIQHGVQVVGHEGDMAFFIVAPNGRAIEHADHVDAAGEGIVLDEGVGFAGVTGPHHHVLHPVCNGMEVGHHGIGLVAEKADGYGVVAFDLSQGLFQGNEFGAVEFLCGHIGHLRREIKRIYSV